MDFLFDTNAVSDLMSKHPRLRLRVNALTAADRIVVCPIVRGEIQFGIALLPTGKKRSQLEASAAQAFEGIVVLPVTDAVADQYGALRASQRHAGLTLTDNDLWIAAVAIEHNATVVTRDMDLGRVAGLRVEDWTV